MNAGTTPKHLAREYFAVTKKFLTEARWLKLLQVAYREASTPKSHPIARNNARMFLLKAAHEDQIKVKHEIDALPPRPLDFKDPESRSMLEELVLRTYADRLHPKAIEVEGRVVEPPKNGTNGNGHAP